MKTLFKFFGRAGMNMWAISALLAMLIVVLSPILLGPIVAAKVEWYVAGGVFFGMPMMLNMLLWFFPGENNE